MTQRTVGTILIGALLATAVAALGCATREIDDEIFERKGVKVFLRQYTKGFTPVGRGFQHPTRISTQRLQHILGAIDIRGREADLVGLRAAFDPSQLAIIAQGLAAGLSKASPNQEIAVQAVRKQMQKVIFDRKYITSFVAYVENDLLYLHMSRVDWKIPSLDTKTKLPMPRVHEHPMKFKVEPSEGMYQEGMYAVSVDWQNAIFRQSRSRVDPGGKRRERVILMESPESPASGRQLLPAELLPRLTATQLREIADLEDARATGQITEGHYRRQLKEILDTARDQPAASD
ncbi:MAG: hypothetical protein VX466_03810 [Myxococcota bacterium]|nr:hypothetical protein [Myxococcota bacterium]